MLSIAKILGADEAVTVDGSTVTLRRPKTTLTKQYQFSAPDFDVATHITTALDKCESLTVFSVGAQGAGKTTTLHGVAEAALEGLRPSHSHRAPSTRAPPQWDDPGGFYDHVSPPMKAPAPDNQSACFCLEAGKCTAHDPRGYDPYTRLGSRLPVILISPWVKKGCACSDPHS